MTCWLPSENKQTKTQQVKQGWYSSWRLKPFVEMFAGIAFPCVCSSTGMKQRHRARRISPSLLICTCQQTPVAPRVHACIAWSCSGLSISLYAQSLPSVWSGIICSLVCSTYLWVQESLLFHKGWLIMEKINTKRSFLGCWSCHLGIYHFLWCRISLPVHRRQKRVIM